MTALRIVSLLPSGTELVGALGGVDELVGISHECDFPPQVSALPRLTSSILDHGLTPAQIDAAVREASLEGRPLYAVDGPRLAALRPDLIVTQGVCAVCAVTETTIESSLRLVPVEQACTAPVVSLGATDWAGIRADVSRLAEAMGRPSAAETLLGRLDERWQRLASTPPSSRPVVAMLEWPDPPWFGGHWVPEQVAVAGGHDPFGTPGAPSRRSTWDALRQADPDLIVGIACGFDLEQNHAHLRKACAGPLAGMRAVTEGRVWAADANAMFSRPGPRVVQGAELLRAIFTGQPVPPEHARRLP
ncbi:MAG: ABC transporter substrate-binding protein [Myxococcota bacterium]